MKTNKVINIANNKNKSVYEVIGIDRDNKIIAYKEGTIEEIIDNELLDDGESVLNSMDDVIKNMDIFSKYTHYYKRIK